MAVDSTGKIKATDIRGDTDSLRVQRAKNAKSEKISDARPKGNEAQIDKINIELAKAINEEIDPTTILNERKDKVARLKELIAKGEYNPSSEQVAKAVGDEIVQEILFAGNSSSDDKDGKLPF